jgi:hypothetical protein
MSLRTSKSLNSSSLKGSKLRLPWLNPPNWTPVADPSGRTTQEARVPADSAVYMPATPDTDAAVKVYSTPFIVTSPLRSVPLYSAARVSRKRDLRSIPPSA